MRLGFAAVVVLGLVGSTQAAPRTKVPLAAPAACPQAARVEVAVPADIDEVRAIVAPAPGAAETAAPRESLTRGPGAAAAVTVLDGRTDRELAVFGAGAWGLQLGQPLPAGRVVVAIDPVLDAPASACVDHVLLLSRGAVVARVVPR